MAFLGRDDILGAEDTEYNEIDCPEWGGMVRIKPLTAMQRARIQGTMAEIYQAKKGYDRLGKSHLQMIAWCVVDEDGKPIFTPGDIDKLGAKNAAPIQRLRDAIMKLSGMDDDAVEEAEEDFTETQESDSLFD
ncbi:hypothetical protein [Nocardiopsis lucentensis]|uniref:hypothetical protein n=1 Tax=Nocardiopsis lucentensis TaxID=53441 RepID=UPI00034BC81C|nr:hypothetical protein [Nocardiopsis lucentensis]